MAIKEVKLDEISLSNISSARAKMKDLNIYLKKKEK